MGSAAARFPREERWRMAKRKNTASVDTPPSTVPGALAPGTPGRLDELATPDRHWAPYWERFIEQHGAWWNHHGVEPVYVLPGEVIDALARRTDGDSSHKPKPALLT